MNIKRKIILPFSIIIIYFLILLTFSFLLVDEQSTWFVDVLNDKLYVFKLAPLYLFFISYIDRCMTTPKIIRIGNRTNSLLDSLIAKIIFTFVYFFLWFEFVIIFSLIKYSNIYERTSGDILNLFVKFFLGYILLNILAEIFRKSENKYISKLSYFIAFIILVIELMVIKRHIEIHTTLKLNFLFSWIFYDSIWSYLALGIIITLLLIYLFKVSVKKDIL